MLYAIVGLLVIILDQWVKFWTAGHIALSSAGEPFIPGILSLANVHNEGAAFGFLSENGARIPFIILAGVFAVVVIIALATNLISGKTARWAIVLVTAGGLSNCLDRVIYGYVQDMFKLEFINFPVFNVADIFITVFAVIFAIAVIFGKTRRDDDEDEEFEDDEDDEDYEEEPKVSRRKQRRLSRRAAEEDEDDDDFEAPAPVKKPKKTPHSRRREKRKRPQRLRPRRRRKSPRNSPPRRNRRRPRPRQNRPPRRRRKIPSPPGSARTPG